MHITVFMTVTGNFSSLELRMITLIPLKTSANVLWIKVPL